MELPDETLIERLFTVITVSIRDTCKGISALPNFFPVCAISHTLIKRAFYNNRSTFAICQARIFFVTVSLLLF